MSLLVDNEKVKRQLRLLVGAGTGSENADIAAYALAGWLDESLGLLAEAKGALLIEDREAAVERIGVRLRLRVGVISDEALRMLAADVLAAAEGRG